MSRVAELLNGCVDAGSSCVMRTVIEAAITRPQAFIATFGTNDEHTRIVHAAATYSGTSWTYHAHGGRKIEAIKAYRIQYTVGLKSAKDAVEAYMADNNLAHRVY